MLNNSQFLLKKRAAGPATSTTPVTATTKKVTVVAPIIGTSQQGKSTLIKFLHEYANQPIDASANLIIGNGLTSATQNVRRYSLRIPRREVLLRRANKNNNTKSSRWTAATTADKETQLRTRRMDRMERRNINDMLREVMARETTPVEVEAEQEHDEDLFARAADMYEEGDSLEVLKAKLESLRLANKEEMLRRNLKRESSFTASSSSSLRTSTKADNEVLRLAKETLAMDAQEAEVEGRETDAKSLYELLAELELESEATTTKKTTSSSSATKFENISRFGMNKNTATCATKTDADLFGLNSTGSSRFSSSSGNKNGMFKSERCEFMLNGHDNELGFEEDEQEECFESLADKIEDLLEDRTLELEMTQVRVEDEPRLILDVIDTPGLLDSASLVDPMIDLEHLALTLDKVRESKGNTSTLVYVINANRPLDASNLTILKTYLSTLGDFTRNLVVVHSGFDFRRALRRTDSFGAKLNLFDLGPRASEFDRHLATTLGFPHIRAIHVPMNNDLAATMPLSPMRAGLRAMSFQAVNHFIDVLEQLAVEVPAPLLTEATMLTTKLPVMPLMRPMTMNMDVTEIVKTKLVRDIDLLAESLVTKKIDMLRNEALLARRVRDAEQLVLREQLARSDAELAAVEYAMSKLDTEDLIEFHTKTGHWTTTTTTTTSGDLLGNEWTTTTLTQDASPYIWRVGASGLTTPLRRGLFANLHLLATPPTPLFAKISIASAEFPIRSVREILPSGMPVAIRHRAVNPTTFELVLTAPMLMSVTSMSTPVIAKLFTFRKDMYAKELLALRERRTHLRAHMAMVRTRLTINAAEEALERQMQAMYRVLEALRGDRMPLDLLLATKDLYRGVSRVLVGEVQQVHQVRVVPNMMRLEAFKSVLDNKPVVVRDLDALVGKMEKFFLGF